MAKNQQRGMVQIKTVSLVKTIAPQHGDARLPRERRSTAPTGSGGNSGPEAVAKSRAVNRLARVIQKHLKYDQADFLDLARQAGLGTLVALMVATYGEPIRRAKIKKDPSAQPDFFPEEDL